MPSSSSGSSSLPARARSRTRDSFSIPDGFSHPNPEVPSPSPSPSPSPCDHLDTDTAVLTTLLSSTFSSSSSSSSPSSPHPHPHHRIALVSDFFYPRLGGVELHQYQIAQALIARGHKVIVITGTYACSSSPGPRQGIRYMTNGLKVYYVPQMSIHSQASLPTLYTFWPLFRQIMIRERIQIVHGHQTTSALAHECLLHARTMGLRAIYTDHSLFGFANAAAIHLNKLMKFTLSDIDHVVCVSHCSRENLVLRAYLDPSIVSVIPNAVDTTKLTPNPENAPNIKERVNIMILSRLVYRKGMDLVVQVIPPICAMFPHVHFIIGGDGGKRLLIEEMREKYQLQDRVTLLGAIPHTRVRDVLTRGHIFLNCSLTEAFCIAILEAVSCGLFVVSTRVGGVPEILPEHMIRFAEPVADDIIRELAEAIPLAQHIDPFMLHEQVKEMYNWHDVAERTSLVYDRVMRSPRSTLWDRLCRYHECGPWAGKLFAAVVALDHVLHTFMETWRVAPHCWCLF